MDTTVRLIRVFLNRWLDKAEEDTGRTLRKLIEFGIYFSNPAPMKRFFTEAKNILSDGGGNYYALARRLFATVTKERISEFGIAFGYYGLARSIRPRGEHAAGHEKTPDVAVVWPPVRHASDDIAPGALSSGKSKESASAVFILCDALAVSETELNALIDRNPRKAFFLFTSDEALSLRFAQKNVMTVFNLDCAAAGAVSERLRKRGRLFGGYRLYGDADDTTSGAFLDRVCGDGYLFLFLIEKDGCMPETCEKISAFSYNEKRRPSHPLFITDLIGDLEWLNNAYRN